MQGKRSMLTILRLDTFQGEFGEFVPFSIPIASVKQVEEYRPHLTRVEQAPPRAPWSEVRGVVTLKGSEGERFYTKDTREEIVEQIETGFVK